MSSRGQWIAVTIIVAGLAGALGAGVALKDDLFPVEVGSHAPDFQAIHLTTGDTLSIADYRGEVVLLNLWATWCTPCREEMPAMQRLYDELGPDGLKVVAVSVDDAGSSLIEEFAAEFGLTFDILHDRKGRIELDYQTTGLPESFVLDREGVIVKKEIGAVEWDHPARQALFRRLLGRDEPATDEVESATGGGATRD